MISIFSGYTNDVGVSVAELAATWWLQSLILLLVGLLVAAFLRRRGPASQSVVYRVTLGAVLLCPIVSQVLAASGVSLLTIDLRRPQTAAGIGETIDALPHAISAPSAPIELNFESDSSQTPLATSRVSIPELPKPPASVESVDDELVVSVSEPSPVSLGASQPATFGKRLSGASVVMLLLSIWALGTLFFVGRILYSAFRAHLLRKRAVPSEALAEQVCGQVASQLGVRTPQVLSTPYLSSPCLLGHWRPIVFVPEETSAATYQQLFLHELAHLRRGDWLWNLIGQCVQALLWFQPLVWLLVRRNATAAEDVCDDYVLEFGCNREGYVRQLLDIAEKSIPQPSMGVSMVGFRSKLGRRAQRILDTSRVLSTRTSRLFAAFALIVTLAATATVGTLVVGQAKVVAADEISGGPEVAAHVESDAGFVRFVGRVRLPSGEPAPGAKVMLRYVKPGNEPSVARTTSNVDGQFDFEIDTVDFDRSQNPTPWNYAQLIATLDGYGFGLSRANKLEAGYVILRLKKDRPVKGRILTLEGQPVANAEVKIERVEITPSGRLDGYLNKVKDGQTGGFRMADHVEMPDRSYRTDKDGRFTIAGIGEHRAVQLILTGKGGVAGQPLEVLTTDLPGIWRRSREAEGDSQATLPPIPSSNRPYGAEFDHFAKPGRVVLGTVIDASSGEPVVGVDVKYGGIDQTKTDAAGQFRIEGVGKNSRTRIHLTTDELPYLNRVIRVTDTPGVTPIEMTIEMHRGLTVRGHVLDQNGNPCSDGSVGYVTVYPNQNAVSHHFRQYPQLWRKVQQDGSFEIPALPGPGMVYFLPNVQGKYADSLMTEEGFSKTFGKVVRFNTDEFMDVAIGDKKQMLRGAFSVRDKAGFALINPADDQSLVKADIHATVADDIRGLVFNPDGSPARDLTLLRGAGSYGGSELTSNEFEVRGYSPKVRRELVFVTKDRSHGARLLLKGEQESPLRVTLEPTGSVTGRLVDADHEPRPNQVIQINEFRHSGPGLVTSRTDAMGRFELKGIVAGVKHMVGLRENWQQIRRFTVQAGETLDLGDISSNRDLERKLKAKWTAQRGNREPSAGTRAAVTRPVAVTMKKREVNLQGKVVDPAGGPVTNATLLLVARTQNAELNPVRQVLQRTRSNKAGQFSFSTEHKLRVDDPRMHGSLHVVAMKPGWGTGWHVVTARELQAATVTVPLHEEKEVTGRIVDLEGRPLGGVRVALTGLAAPKENVDLDKWHAKAKKNPTAVDHSYIMRAGDTGPEPYVRFPAQTGISLHGVTSLSTTVTKADGSFEIRGVGRNHNATLVIAGKGVATTLIGVVAREMEAVNMPTPDSRFGTQKMYGAMFSYAAHPSRSIRGRVVDKKTRRGLAGVKIQATYTINGAHDSDVIVSDEQGRFEIDSLPARDGQRLRVRADHIPYFRPEDFEIPKTPAATPIDIEVELERGEWITGRLTNAETDEPITEGWVSYYPFLSNEHAEKMSHYRRDMMSVGYSDRVPVNSDGTYRIVGAPGRGIILCGAKNSGIFKHGAGAEKIEGLLRKGKNQRPRVYHLFSVKIGNSVGEVLAKEGEGATCNIALEPLDRHKFSVVDSRRQPLTGYRVTGLLPSAMNVQNPFPELAPIRDEPTFEVYGLADEIPRTLLLQHPERKLAQAVEVNPARASKNQSIALHPAATISGRVLTASGKPAVGATVYLQYKVKASNFELGREVTEKPAERMMYFGNADVGADGTFSFELVPPGISYSLGISTGDGAQKENIEIPKIAVGQQIDLGQCTLKVQKQEQQAASLFK